jgi:hypothetical protein
MRRVIGIAVALVLVMPGAAIGKTTKDFTYKSTGKAATPDPGNTGADGTFEEFPFTIAADEANGSISVEVHWTNPFDDFDLYVYRKNSTGGVDQVGSSASGPPSTSESTVIQQQGSSPVEPGQYVIHVQNYTATSPDFAGVVKFTEFKVPNAKPTAKLKAPSKASRKKAVKLDASGSKDSDGNIVNYAFDLDGDGSIETNNGSKAVLKHKFSAGVHHVTVRVTDNGGKRAYATRTIRVN